MDNSGTDNSDLPKSILSGDDGTPKVISSADIAPATEDEHRATASRYASSSRSRFNRRQESANNFAASVRLAADPNTPDFFKDAVMDGAIQPAANSRASRSASLSAAKPRKSHKGLIFAVVAILVLAAGGAVAWYFLKDSEIFNTGTIAASDCLKTFNESANYLLYSRGDEFALIGEFDSQETYTVYAPEDQRPEQYRAGAEKRIEKIRSIGRECKIKAADRSLLTIYADEIEAWLYYLYFSEDTNTLIAKFEESGDVAAKTYIEEKYANLAKSSEDAVANLGSMFTSIRDMQIAYIRKFEIDGCKISELTESCADKLSEFDEADDTMVNSDELMSDISNASSELLTDALPKTWMLSKMLEEAAL